MIRDDLEPLLNRFDDDFTLLRYVYEDGMVKGIFIGVALALFFWVLS